MAKKNKPFTLEDGWGKMRREVRLLTAIHPYPNNPRTHPPAQIAMLAAMLKKHGPDQDIVVDGDEDYILKGHGRRLAAIAAGLHEFPVTIRYGLSEADKIEMRIQDNQVALLSGWDPELIRGEMALLKSLGGDLGGLGFGEAQLVQFTTSPSPPSGFPQVGEDLDVDHQCPKCGYVGSGDWSPKKAKPNGKKAAKK